MTLFSNWWRKVKQTAQNFWEWLKSLFRKKKPRQSPSKAQGKPKKASVTQTTPSEEKSVSRPARGTRVDVSDTPIAPTEAQKRELPNLSDSVFRARLRSIMTDNKYDRKVRARKQGKLDMTRLYKVKVKETNIFTQKQARQGKEYNVTLLIDESGSMQGDRIKQAAHIATFLVKNINESLNLSMEVVGFSDNAYLHKKREETVKDFDELDRAIRSAGQSGTNLTKGLKVAYGRMRNLTGTNILITLTDGDANDKTSAKAVLRANEGLAKAIGVGICHDTSQIFPNAIRVNNVEELKPQLIGQLNKLIRRG